MTQEQMCAKLAKMDAGLVAVNWRQVNEARSIFAGYSDSQLLESFAASQRYGQQTQGGFIKIEILRRMFEGVQP